MNKTCSISAIQFKEIYNILCLAEVSGKMHRHRLCAHEAVSTEQPIVFNIVWTKQKQPTDRQIDKQTNNQRKKTRSQTQ